MNKNSRRRTEEKKLEYEWFNRSIWLPHQSWHCLWQRNTRCTLHNNALAFYGGTSDAHQMHRLTLFHIFFVFCFTLGAFEWRGDGLLTCIAIEMGKKLSQHTIMHVITITGMLWIRRCVIFSHFYPAVFWCIELMRSGIWYVTISLLLGIHS